MDFFSDNELDNIKIMAKKYFGKEKLRKLIVIKNDYIIIEHVTNLFKKNGILLPEKYDNLIHEGVVNVMTEYVNSREGKELFHKIFLVSMRKYDFVVVLFLKKFCSHHPDFDYEVYNIGYNLLSFFITFNDEQLEDREKADGVIVAGVEPIYFTIDF